MLGNTENDISKDKNVELVLKFGITELILLHCNMVHNNYPQTLKVLFTFVLSKVIGQLTNITSHSLVTVNIDNLELSFVMIWFTSQNNKPLLRSKYVNKLVIYNNIYIIYLYYIYYIYIIYLYYILYIYIYIYILKNCAPFTSCMSEKKNKT